MALLLRDRETAPDAAPQPPGGPPAPTAPDFACETCGAAMERGQDWCLECGTAAPGRLGMRPGRTAFTVVGLTALLSFCAVLAAYAALTSDAERTAAKPSAGSGQPIVAGTPGAATPAAPGAVQPGATGPGVTPPAGQPNTAPIIPTSKPPPGASNTRLAPPATPTPPSRVGGGSSGGADRSSGGTGSGQKSTGGSSRSTGGDSGRRVTTASTGPGTIAFRKGAARNYDPTKRPGVEFGPPSYAIDASRATVWDVVTPADGRPIDAGLVIDLGRPHALSSLRLATPTPGFTLEVYGAKSSAQLPVDVIDKRWIHLTDDKGVRSDELISLKGKGEGAKIEMLLLHIKRAADATDPRVAIGDVTLRGTP